MKKTFNAICHLWQKLFGLKKSLSSTELKYPQDYEIHEVQHQGNISWMKATIYIRRSLAGESVAIKKINDQFYEVYYGNKRLETLDRFRRCTI